MDATPIVDISLPTLSDNTNNDISSNTNEVVVLPLYTQQHQSYIVHLAETLSQSTSYEGAITEHLRMSGIYWSLTTLHILLPKANEANELLNATFTKEVTTTSSSSLASSLSTTPTTLIDWLWTCYNPHNGSFGGNTGHEGHILYTLSALQILALVDQIQTDPLRQHRSSIIQYIVSLQQQDGSFVGDDNGAEIDTRFTYCAYQSLALLGALHAVNVEKGCLYLQKCRNLDGGFGSCPGAESHAGQVFCCVAAFAIAQRLDLLVPDSEQDRNEDEDLLAWWLCERQCDSGGLNGRPEKQADVCYSWWNISALSILDRVNWINTDKLAQYILKCQDPHDGGIADRPEDMADAFHTFFGIGGLSLLGHLHRGEHLEGRYRKIDPLYALPTDIVRRMKLPGQVIAFNEEGVDERLSHYSILDLRDK